VRNLTDMGYDPIDPVLQDNETLWPTGVAGPSRAFRNLAFVEDVKSFSEAGVSLMLLPGWIQYPEAEAMVAVAKAMGREVHELSEEIFKEP